MPRAPALAALLLAPLLLAAPACSRPESEETKAATSRADPKVEPGSEPDRLMPRSPERRERPGADGAPGPIKCSRPVDSVPCAP